MRSWLTYSSLCVLLASAAPAADEGWVTLFDGKTLDGWKINENPETWQLADGALTCHGERSHVFYAGPHAPFRDFELELEVLTRKNSNAGVYFHTKLQDEGWPAAGFECQVNNTYESDPRKTGSLYRVKDVMESAARDDEWWTYNIRVQGKQVTLKVNGKVVNEYTEPSDAAAVESGRVLGEGTFALQGHDPKSTVSFRNIRVRKLSSSGSTEQKGVNVGDAAPSFTLKDDTGKDWKSSEHLGQGITVVYFYPADFTGGCTKQACSYRDDFSELKDLGVDVVGVSGDSVETHQAFKKHHNLNFTLLSDPQGEVAAKFGVPVTLGEKIAKATVDGEEVTFVRTASTARWTFVVKDGRIAAVDSKVNAAGDSARIQELVKSLQ
jgi:peroxiredoxin